MTLSAWTGSVPVRQSMLFEKRSDFLGRRGDASTSLASPVTGFKTVKVSKRSPTVSKWIKLRVLHWRPFGWTSLRLRGAAGRRCLFRNGGGLRPEAEERNGWRWQCKSDRTTLNELSKERPAVEDSVPCVKCLDLFWRRLESGSKRISRSERTGERCDCMRRAVVLCLQDIEFEEQVQQQRVVYAFRRCGPKGIGSAKFSLKCFRLNIALNLCADQPKRFQRGVQMELDRVLKLHLVLFDNNNRHHAEYPNSTASDPEWTFTGIALVDERTPARCP